MTSRKDADRSAPLASQNETPDGSIPTEEDIEALGEMDLSEAESDLI